MRFDDAWPLLEKAAQRGDHITRGDVEQGLKTGRYVIFYGEQSAVLCVIDGPTLRIALAGGEMQECLMLYHRNIKPYAIQMRCEFLEIIGREGWGRLIPEMKQVAVLLRCEL